MLRRLIAVALPLVFLGSGCGDDASKTTAPAATNNAPVETAKPGPGARNAETTTPGKATGNKILD